MGIFQHRLDVTRALGSGLEVVKGLAHWPAVIAAFDDQINFLPIILPHIARPQFAGLTIPAEAPCVAES